MTSHAAFIIGRFLLVAVIAAIAATAFVPSVVVGPVISLSLRTSSSSISGPIRRLPSSCLLETTKTASLSSSSSPRMGELTPPETKVYDFLEDLRASKFPFRVVVVGKGAILESTAAALGPKLSISQSPSTGANLLTLASEDHSFEFHVQLSQVSKIVILEKETPAKTLRIIRLLNALGESMSSLILVEHQGESDDGGEATKWFHNLVEKYGSEIQL